MSTQLPSGATYFIYGVSLHLLPNFMYASSKGSGETRLDMLGLSEPLMYVVTYVSAALLAVIHLFKDSETKSF